MSTPLDTAAEASLAVYTAHVSRAQRSGHGPTVRVATSNDASAVKALLTTTLRSLYPGGELWLSGRLDDIAGRRAAAFVSYVGEALTGAAILTPKGAQRMKLSTIYVAPEARGRGVGSALVRAAVGCAYEVGVSEMWVTVAHHIADELRPLLHGSGFTQTALVSDRYGPGRDEAIFTLLP